MHFRFLLMLTLFAGLCLVGSRSAFGQDPSATYTYQVLVSLKGHITLEEPAAAGEKSGKVFVLRLNVPITVLGRPDDKANRTTENGVVRIQVRADTAELKETLAEFEKSQGLAKVSGKLSRDADGKSNTPVLMEVTRIIPQEGE